MQDVHQCSELAPGMAARLGIAASSRETDMDNQVPQLTDGILLI